MTDLESSLLMKNQQEQTFAENSMKIQALEHQIEELQNRLRESEQETNVSSETPSAPFDIPGGFLILL